MSNFTDFIFQLHVELSNKNQTAYAALRKVVEQFDRAFKEEAETWNRRHLHRERRADPDDEIPF